jgi:hypothetical protein
VLRKAISYIRASALCPLSRELTHPGQPRMHTPTGHAKTAISIGRSGPTGTPTGTGWNLRRETLWPGVFPNGCKTAALRSQFGNGAGPVRVGNRNSRLSPWTLAECMMVNHGIGLPKLGSPG